MVALKADLVARVDKLRPVRFGEKNRKWKEGLAEACSWEDLVAASKGLIKNAELYETYTSLTKVSELGKGKRTKVRSAHSGLFVVFLMKVLFQGSRGPA